MQNIDLTEKRECYKNLPKLNIRNNFWSCKFPANANLNKKVENYKLKEKYKLFLKVYVKMDKTTI